MEAFLLTDWLTASGFEGPGAVTSNESAYLDLSAYDDVVIHVDVKEVTGAVTLALQTAPSKDDASFVAMLPGIALTPTTSGPLVYRVFGNYAPIPVAKWLRWQLTSTVIWGVTLRIFVYGHAYGGRS